MIYSAYFTRGIKEENFFAIPDKKQIIAHLRIWVNAVYRNTSESQLAGQYLKLCIQKISEKKMLRGDQESIIEHYKNQIIHALERDQLLHKIASLRFQHTILDKSRTSSETHRACAVKQSSEKKKDELEKKIKLFRWQCNVVKTIHALPFSDPPPFSQASLIEEIMKRTQVESESHATQLEQKVLPLHIDDDQSEEAGKRTKIDDLQRKVDECFKETDIQEKKLLKFRAESLKKIKELNEEIAQCIENIKIEPQRLNTLFDPLDRGYSEENQNEWDRISKERKLIYESFFEKLEEQKSVYEKDFAKQSGDAEKQKIKIAKRYQEIISAKNLKYENKLREISEKSDREMIVNKSSFSRQNHHSSTQARRKMKENSHIDTQLKEGERAYNRNRSEMHKKIKNEFSNIKSRYSNQWKQLHTILLAEINRHVNLVNEENSHRFHPEKKQLHNELKTLLDDLLKGENDT